MKAWIIAVSTVLAMSALAPGPSAQTPERTVDCTTPVRSERLSIYDVEPYLIYIGAEKVIAVHHDPASNAATVYFMHESGSMMVLRLVHTTDGYWFDPISFKFLCRGYR